MGLKSSRPQVMAARSLKELELHVGAVNPDVDVELEATNSETKLYFFLAAFFLVAFFLAFGAFLAFTTFFAAFFLAAFFFAAMSFSSMD